MGRIAADTEGDVRGRASNWYRRNRVEVLIFLLVLAVVGPLVQAYKAQQASRYLFTAAMWDKNTFELDEYAAIEPPVLGVDRSFREGHTYSDKPPLQPMLALPFYAAYRAVGGETAENRRIDENLGLWWITFWMASIPAALLAVLMYRYARRMFGAATPLHTIALFMGSLLLPFGAMLFGHELAALFAFGAFYLVSDRAPPSTARVGVAGLLIGASVATEYTAVIVVPVLGLYLLWRVRAKAAWYVLGGAPAAIFVAWYHNAVFGSPLSHPYRWSVFSTAPVEERAISPLVGFSFDNLVDVFVGGRGFAVATPLVVVALFGLVTLIRSGSTWHRSVALPALGIFLGFLLVPALWSNPWGGDSPGPRYMTVAFPFLVVGVVAAWPKVKRLAALTAVVGVLTMFLATFTDPILSKYDTGGIGIWLSKLFDDGLAPTVFTIAIGPLGWLIHIALVGAAVYYLRNAWAEEAVADAATDVVEPEPA